MFHVKKNILEGLPIEIRDKLNKLCFIADELGYSSYIVGGMVRDWILNLPIRDIDIAIEGDAIFVAKIYQKQYNASVQYFEGFRTATISIANKEFENIDLISTRKETYKSPGSLPQVKKGNLKDDLYRRDFTINALCYHLDTMNIVDLFKGIKDIQNKLIRVLHSKSFVDDPIRILRAIRFKNRLHFNYELSTKKYMEEAIDQGAFSTISSDRIKKELFLCLKEEEFESILLDMKTFSILEILFFIEDISPMQLDWLQTVYKAVKDESRILVNLLIILYNTCEENIKKFCFYYHINKKYSNLLINNKRILLEIENSISRKAICPFEIYKIFSNLLPEQKLFFQIYFQDKPLLKEALEFYNDKLQSIRIEVTGRDLIELGIKPGPIYSKIFHELLKSKINYGWKTKIEEIEHIKKYIKDWRV